LNPSELKIEKPYKKKLRIKKKFEFPKINSFRNSMALSNIRLKLKFGLFLDYQKKNLKKNYKQIIVKQRLPMKKS